MTLQFRSRARSTFNFGPDLKQTGKCCFSNGTSSSITFLECFNQGGQFFTNPETSCPTTAEKGHCCSCHYNSNLDDISIAGKLPYNDFDALWRNQFGIKSNITKCECDRIGGNWLAGNTELTSDQIVSLCKKNVIIDGVQKTIDARIKMACCYMLIQDNIPIGVTCQNVCGQRACANLVQVESGPNDPFVDSVYSENKRCTDILLPGISPVTCSSAPITSRMATFTDAFSGELFGPCFTLNEDSGQYSYSCSITPSFTCDGYWIDPLIDSEEVVFCNHRFSPKNPTKISGYVDPIKYTQDEFEALGLEPGDEFQGGIYIGTFKPYKSGSAYPSKVYGSLNFSSPQSTLISVSNESPYYQWAIIVDKSSLNTKLLTDQDSLVSSSTSYYDGYINCYGEPSVMGSLNSKTIKSIIGIQRNGFIDYYIPSIIEMMFFAEQLKLNSSLSEIFDMKGVYCSTTLFDDKYSAKFPTGQNTFENSNFIYGLDMTSGEKFGRSMILGINSNVKLMLFRRIVIT